MSVVVYVPIQTHTHTVTVTHTHTHTQSHTHTVKHTHTHTPLLSLDMTALLAETPLLQKPDGDFYTSAVDRGFTTAVKTTPSGNPHQS